MAFGISSQLGDTDEERPHVGWGINVYDAPDPLRLHHRICDLVGVPRLPPMLVESRSVQYAVRSRWACEKLRDFIEEEEMNMTDLQIAGSGKICFCIEARAYMGGTHLRTEVHGARKMLSRYYRSIARNANHARYTNAKFPFQSQLKVQNGDEGTPSLRPDLDEVGWSAGLGAICLG